MPTRLVEGSSFHGIHGLTFDDQDRLYAGSVVGQSIYRIDTDSGGVETFKAPPTGMADDLEFGPDGDLVWTSFLMGTVHAQKPDGELRVLAEGLPGANSLAFDRQGRLFMSQVFAADALWELDPEGQPRLAKEAGAENPSTGQLSLVLGDVAPRPPEEAEVMAALRDLDPEATTPIDALLLLTRLRTLLAQGRKS